MKELLAELSILESYVPLCKEDKDQLNRIEEKLDRLLAKLR
jgi:hypothetical protein